MLQSTLQTITFIMINSCVKPCDHITAALEVLSYCSVYVLSIIGGLMANMRLKNND